MYRSLQRSLEMELAANRSRFPLSPRLIGLELGGQFKFIAEGNGVHFVRLSRLAFRRLHPFFPHRAWAARRAEALRWAGLSLALSVAAPLRPPRRPMAAITWEIIA